MPRDNWHQRSINQGASSDGAPGFIIQGTSVFQTEGAGALPIPATISVPISAFQVTNTVSDDGASLATFGIAPRDFLVRSLTVVITGTATVPTDTLSFKLSVGPVGGPFVDIGGAGPAPVAPDTAVTMEFEPLPGNDNVIVPAGFIYEIKMGGNTLGSIGPASETYSMQVSIDAAFV